MRKPAGEWIGAHMADDEAVGCEPLGYMAYYSRKVVWDWPGLCSPTVVEYSRNHPDGRALEDMLRTLRPDYLFLRDVEVLRFFDDPAFIYAHYHPVALFRTDPEVVNEIRWVRRNMDTVFRIYRKNPTTGAPDYDESLWPVRGGAEHGQP